MIKYSAGWLLVLFFLAIAASCVLVVNKESLENIVGKADVEELTATKGATEIELHWKNPRAADALKIEIWYGKTESGLNNHSTIENIKAGEPQSKKISSLSRYTNYLFKVVVVYTDGSKSSGKVIYASTTY